MRLGITTAIYRKSSANGTISTWHIQSLDGSLISMKKVITKAITNNVMPATPRKAMNLSFSIFLTKVKGIYRKASMITMNHVLEYQASVTSYESNIFLREPLKIVNSTIQIPKLLIKMANEHTI